jgi:hypothetical protein
MNAVKRRRVEARPPAAAILSADKNQVIVGAATFAIGA